MTTQVNLPECRLQINAVIVVEMKARGTKAARQLGSKQSIKPMLRIVLGSSDNG